MNLKCSLNDLKLPRKTILIRFAVGHEVRMPSRKYGIRSILAAYLPADGQKTEGITVVTTSDDDKKDPSSRCFWITELDRPLDEICKEMEDKEARTLFPEERDLIEEQAITISDSLKAAISLMLMSKDKDFIRPDVLTADRAEFDRTDDQRLIEKAKKRGVNGFRVGEAFEAIPHIRRPHFGLRWTGEGKKIQKIVPIKGSLVHRQKIVEVPTGHFVDWIEEEL